MSDNICGDNASDAGFKHLDDLYAAHRCGEMEALAYAAQVERMARTETDETTGKKP